MQFSLFSVILKYVYCLYYFRKRKNAYSRVQNVGDDLRLKLNKSN